jgi:hypothetical protein
MEAPTMPATPFRGRLVRCTGHVLVEMVTRAYTPGTQPRGLQKLRERTMTDAEASPPGDIFLVLVEATDRESLRGLLQDPAIDFGCRPHVRSLGDGAVQVDAFIDERKIRELQAIPGLTVSILRNATASLRERQREVGIGDRFEGGATVPRGFGEKIQREQAT